jgi:hypothetical protein
VAEVLNSVSSKRNWFDKYDERARLIGGKLKILVKKVRVLL